MICNIKCKIDTSNELPTTISLFALFQILYKGTYEWDSFCLPKGA